VRVIVKPPSDRYQDFLLSGEVASGAVSTVEVFLTNRGFVPFPGGVLTAVYEIRGTSPTRLGAMNLTGEEGAPITIPVIDPQQERKVLEVGIICPIPGLDWLFVSAKAQDNIPVLLAKGPTGVGSDRSGHPVAVVSRVQLELLLALRERRIA
jgi:hypothetical protein